MELSNDYRYCLSKNDLAIIKMNSDKPISENTRKTLTILSEVFGGLHHLDSDQLELFDYQSDRYNDYLISSPLATFDASSLSGLVIMAHDMMVRLEITATFLNEDDDNELALLKMQAAEQSEDYEVTVEDLLENPHPYIRLRFHQREGREGRYYERHPTLEDAMEIWRNDK